MTSTFIYSGGGASNSQDLSKVFFFYPPVRFSISLFCCCCCPSTALKSTTNYYCTTKGNSSIKVVRLFHLKGLSREDFAWGWDHNFHQNKYGKESRLKSLLIQELKENGEEADSGGTDFLFFVSTPTTTKTFYFSNFGRDHSSPPLTPYSDPSPSFRFCCIQQLNIQMFW
jgi:hypothetical protein